MIVLLPLLYHSLQLLSVTWEVEENLCLRLFDSVLLRRRVVWNRREPSILQLFEVCVVSSQEKIPLSSQHGEEGRQEEVNMRVFGTELRFSRLIPGCSALGGSRAAFVVHSGFAEPRSGGLLYNI
jgi:hypothetical protein